MKVKVRTLVCRESRTITHGGSLKEFWVVVKPRE